MLCFYMVFIYRNYPYKVKNQDEFGNSHTCIHDFLKTI